MSQLLPTEQVGASSASAQAKPGPQGIGMAVALDWGLVVQIASMPFIALILHKPATFTLGGLSPLLNALVIFLISLPFVALLAFFGESIRRGKRWAGRIQLVANVLLFLGGLVSLVNLWHSIQAGNYWPLVSSFILVIISPLIVWGFTRPRTRAWFATVTSAEARQRHGGAWPYLIMLWSLVGGILQALASVK